MTSLGFKQPRHATLTIGESSRFPQHGARLWRSFLAKYGFDSLEAFKKKNPEGGGGGITVIGNPIARCLCKTQPVHGLHSDPVTLTVLQAAEGTLRPEIETPVSRM